MTEPEHEPEGYDPEDLQTLKRLRRAIFKYPMATQAAFAALVAEGRRYALTDEGAEWRKRLGHAKATGRARMLWETLSLGTFSDRIEEPLPGALAEALLQTLRRQHLEPLLAKLFGKDG